MPAPMTAKRRRRAGAGFHRLTSGAGVGLTRATREPEIGAVNKPDLPIAIVGAGFAGIGTAIRLKKAGIESFTIFERAGEIGGTWRDNTYPGAACDVPSHVYSLSFEPNPGWTRKFSPSGEIQAYLLRLVDKWQLRRHLRLGTEIVEARFDEARGVWTLDHARGRDATRRAWWSRASAAWSIPRCPTSRASRASAARSSTPRAGTTTTT